MTPDDLSTVQRSWSELQRLRVPLLAGLTRRFDAAAPSPVEAALRSRWLFEAVEELVGLLAAPSRLAARARGLGQTWPDPLTAPSFRIEGRAWMGAAGDCLPTWSEDTEVAWRKAWLLLSDVLAAETLSPFMDSPRPDTTQSPGRADRRGQAAR
jgi:hypothetical protein